MTQIRFNTRNWGKFNPPLDMARWEVVDSVQLHLRGVQNVNDEYAWIVTITNLPEFIDIITHLRSKYFNRDIKISVGSSIDNKKYISLSME